MPHISGVDPLTLEEKDKELEQAKTLGVVFIGDGVWHDRAGVVLGDNEHKYKFAYIHPEGHLVIGDRARDEYIERAVSIREKDMVNVYECEGK